MVILGGWAVSHERSVPLATNHQPSRSDKIDQSQHVTLRKWVNPRETEPAATLSSHGGCMHAAHDARARLCFSMIGSGSHRFVKVAAYRYHFRWRPLYQENVVHHLTGQEITARKRLQLEAE